MTDAKDLYLKTLAQLCTGADFWHSHGAESLGIPQLTMSDGPHGLRKQDETADHLGIHDSLPAICFPCAAALACSFDREIAARVGALLGQECRAEGIHLLLGPAMNIKRTPLCGRNFEYFSEDPYLTGELAFCYVTALQSEGVGACVKHFAVNNQENGRMTLSANVSERALREIYLEAFRRVTQARPRAVMSSYNRLNGCYVGESKELLNDVLRDQWGFDGIVISDWYAVNDRVESLKAGLDLEMPGGPLASAQKLEDAAKSGALDLAILEKSAERIAETAKALSRPAIGSYDKEAHHAAAAEIAAQCAVLLKNDNEFFPLKSSEKTLFIGEYAAKPRFQGGGSSHVNAYRVTGVTENMKGFAVDFLSFTADSDRAAIKKAVKTAQSYDKIVVFAGLPDACESEGYDRKNIDLPERYDQIISALAQAGRRVGVALFHGSPVAMPWVKQVSAILSMQLAGEGAGEACADLLTGRAVPSGRLAESYPQRLEHNPSYLNSANLRNVNYNEGVFVGYRYYCSKKIKPLFPFGHGLSYTTFTYDCLRVQEENGQVSVAVNVTNSGDYAGKEVVQLYVSPPPSRVDRPATELKGFQKIFLNKGETKTVEFTLKKRDFAYYDQETSDFFTESGTYGISISQSAEQPILQAAVHVEGDLPFVTISDHTTLAELLLHPKTAGFVNNLLSKFGGGDLNRNMALNAPLRLVAGVAKLDQKGYEAFKLNLKNMLER